MASSSSRRELLASTHHCAKVRKAGAIFSLKNNYDWADNVDHVIGGRDDSPVVIEVTFVRPVPRPE